MRKAHLIVILIIFCASGVSAQKSLDLLTISGRYGLPAAYTETTDKKAQESGILINLKVPIPIGQKTVWYNDFTYTNFIVNSEATFTPEIFNPIKLSGFIFQTGVVRQLNSTSALQLIIAPRFMTDFEDVNGKNWQLGGIVLYEKVYSEKLTMRFGALYNTELFGPIITPIVYTDWRISDRWSLVGMWPIYGKLNYHISENTTTGFSHFGLTTTYRLGGQDYRNDYIERNSIDLTLFLRQRIAGNVHIEGRFGHTLSRRFAQYGEDQKLDARIIIFGIGDDRVQKNENFANGMLFNLRLVYNYPI